MEYTVRQIAQACKVIADDISEDFSQNDCRFLAIYNAFKAIKTGKVSRTIRDTIKERKISADSWPDNKDMDPDNPWVKDALRDFKCLTKVDFDPVKMGVNYDQFSTIMDVMPFKRDASGPFPTDLDMPYEWR